MNEFRLQERLSVEELVSEIALYVITKPLFLLEKRLNIIQRLATLEYVPVILHPADYFVDPLDCFADLFVFFCLVCFSFFCC